MTLLIDKEIRVAKRPDYFFHREEDRTVARAQLRKVIAELSGLEPFDHDTWNFGVVVRKWLEAAKKEIG